MARASPDKVTQLDSTLDALQNGLPRITDAAKDAVGSWLTALRGQPELGAIADELQKLQDAIAANHGGSIADALSTLSEQTKQAAVKATPDVQSKLYQLSDVLKLSASQVGR